MSSMDAPTLAKADLFRRNGPLIGDRWLAATSGGVKAHINPSTGAAQAEVLVGGAAEIEAAIAAAKPAQAEWRRRTPDQRRDALFTLAGLVAAAREEFGLLGALES